ncbi:MAG: sle [Acidimicrobiales bacterium]|nr:sle [Acidimicrobiales bacterium]
MAEPWTFAGEVASIGQGGATVTLLEGASFSLSDRTGDFRQGAAHGLFFFDTRFLSQFELRIDGWPVESLGVDVTEPFNGVFFGRSRPASGLADSGLVVFRRRSVGRGMREELEVRNYLPEARTAEVELRVGADFADLFEVKEGRVRARGAYSSEVEPAYLRFGRRHGQDDRAVTVAFTEPADVSAGWAAWTVPLEPSATWTVCIDVTGELDGRQVTPRSRCGEPFGDTKPERRLREWRARVPSLDTDDPDIEATTSRSCEDLAALRMFDPDHPDLPVVAAGAPWFMTLFGRDSLITAWMALIVDPQLALGVLGALARMQGRRYDADTEEEPGKILHELRFGSSGSASFADAERYYGTIDATPLFVMLAGELLGWGYRDQAIALLPNIDRAMEWIDRKLAEGDGFVHYQRTNPRGLANQGWKDSWDGIRYADGTVAVAPIALCEVQGYAYAALLARARLARDLGDPATEEQRRKEAAALRERFDDAYWLPDRGWCAVGLDGDGHPIDSLTSNFGHCLWTGIVHEDRAPALVSQLVSPELYSGWGIRTLATSMGGYNPVSYHCGSVWPHDTALAAAGLSRYGFVAEAHQVVSGLKGLAVRSGYRLPELLSGLGPDELLVPAAYPTSCVPQAWAAASPLLLLRVMLGFDPVLDEGRIRVAPELPAWLSRLRLERIPLATGPITVDVGHTTFVQGLGNEVGLTRELGLPGRAPSGGPETG